MGHATLRNVAQPVAGQTTVAVVTAIMAVFAAVATLLANHSSVTSLAHKNEAVLYQSQAADQYNYYEAQRIRGQIDQGLLDAGISAAAGAAAIRSRLARENAKTGAVLAKAQELEMQAHERFAESEKTLASYEKYEVAAVLFQISIVLASMTALTKGKMLLFAGGAVTLGGLGFLITGFVS